MSNRSLPSWLIEQRYKAPDGEFKWGAVGQCYCCSRDLAIERATRELTAVFGPQVWTLRATEIETPKGLIQICFQL